MQMTATAQQTRLSRDRLFEQVLTEHRQLICKICYNYATDTDLFNDLYQETLANIWQGLQNYRGDAKLSTWLYRVCLNSCITYYRRHRSHEGENVSLDSILHLPDEDGTRLANLREMYRLISTLEPMEKALILMWLDQLPYEEIAQVSGLTRNTVATRLRRIKEKLVKRAQL